MKRCFTLLLVLVLVLSFGVTVLAKGGGFDEFGYNDRARIFVGPADGVDRDLDGTVWGDSTYANDRLVMKWNQAWDACNEAGNDDEEACAGAWVTNEWNGMVSSARLSGGQLAELSG